MSKDIDARLEKLKELARSKGIDEPSNDNPYSPDAIAETRRAVHELTNLLSQSGGKLDLDAPVESKELREWLSGARDEEAARRNLEDLPAEDLRVSHLNEAQQMAARRRATEGIDQRSEHILPEAEVKSEATSIDWSVAGTQPRATQLPPQIAAVIRRGRAR